MTDRFARLKEILLKVADLPDRERESFLDEACKGDPELREEVESILAKDTKTHGILKTGGALPLNSEEPSEPSDMIDRTLSHFRIDEKIAAGGMGVLYKATDLRLRRQVAIKVLRPDVLSHPGIRERFVREARAASALNHPGIVTVHDIDTDSGVDFIAMEYVEGKTLDELIMPEGLPLESVTRYALEIADALRVAHEKGIVHRDLKPSNIMITGNNKVKILDFGIAKRLYPASGDGTEAVPPTQITQAGGFIGTLRYVSPEQGCGGEVDQRTDIWSFGVTLFEMVTGKLPFGGEDNEEVIRSILNTTHGSVTSFRSDVPPVFEEIIDKCLEKEKSARYQDAEELVSDLQQFAGATATIAGFELAGVRGVRRRLVSRWPWVAASAVIAVVVAVVLFRNFPPFGTPPTPGMKMLAVLPFENLGPPEDEYFADGLTEEIISRLASVGDLGVISRTSSYAFKDTERTLPQIASALGVDYILEGSIRWDKTGDTSKVLITPQLIDMSSDVHIWSDRYERPLTEIFVVQAEIAGHIVDALGIKLGTTDRRGLMSSPTTDVEAYNLYLKGRFHTYKATEETTENAIGYFNEALNIDPDFALAHFGLSEAYHVMGQVMGLPQKEYIPKAEEAALRALEIDSTLAEVHAKLADIKISYYWDWAGAEQDLRRAVRLNPQSIHTYIVYTYYLVMMRRIEEAIVKVEKAKKLDPLSIYAAYLAGVCYYLNGDFERALGELNMAMELDSESWLIHDGFGQIYTAMGEYAKAITSYKAAVNLGGGTLESLPWLGYTYAVSGNEEEARNVIDQLNERSKDKYVPKYYFAVVYAGLGDRELALSSLEQAYRDRDYQMIFILMEYTFTGLRSEPRFIALLEKMELG
jgi:serine/threonine-protein kinase